MVRADQPFFPCFFRFIAPFRDEAEHLNLLMVAFLTRSSLQFSLCVFGSVLVSMGVEAALIQQVKAGEALPPVLTKGFVTREQPVGSVPGSVSASWSGCRCLHTEPVLGVPRLLQQAVKARRLNSGSPFLYHLNF